MLPQAMTLRSARSCGEVGCTGLSLPKESLRGTASTWQSGSVRTDASHSPPAGKSGVRGAVAQTGHWVSRSTTEKLVSKLKWHRMRWWGSP